MLLSFRPFVRLVPLFALCLGALILFGPAPSRGAATTLYFVSPTGSDTGPGYAAAPFQTIQHAINTASSGDTILVNDGTYTGPGNVDLDFGGKNLTVQSLNGPASTIIDCQGSSTANHRGFYLHSGETSAIINGFTIQNGYIGGSSSGADEANGGGGIFDLNVRVTVEYCLFKNNTANYGGGLYNHTIDAVTVTVINCAFSGNSASYGGASYDYNESSGKISVTGCTVTNNFASTSGGGFYNVDNTGGTVTISGCTITGNTSSGNSGSGIPDGGGGIYSNDFGGTTRVTNCVLTGNSAAYSGFGGGLYNHATGGTILVTSCTLTSNKSAAGSGGGIDNSLSSGTITLTDDIAYGDTGGDVAGSLVTATYCDIQGGYMGTGNINADPLFSTSPSNLHLQSASPCLGAGTATGAPTKAIDGQARPNPPSIGAYEVTQPVVTTTTTLTSTLNPSVAGQYVFFQANVAGTGATPTGTVVFTIDGAARPPVILYNSRSVRYASSSLSVGTHTVTAAYSGDTNFSPSTSAPLTQTVTAHISPQYVSPTGDDSNPGTQPLPKLTIQAAINATLDSDTVIVEDGTYTGLGNVDIDFEGINITLTSQNGPVGTIINCGSSADPNHRGFYLSAGERNAVIRGFTIQNGVGNNQGIAYYSNGQGGGIYNSSPGLTVQNCLLKNNAANGSSGGGISNSGTLTVTGCTLSSNTAPSSGGGIYNSGTLTVKGCTLSSDMAASFGGGIYNESGILTVTSSTLSGNSAYDGGGIDSYTYTAGSFALVNCMFAGNSASSSSGGLNNDSYYGANTVTNCTFTGNTSGISSYIGGDGSSTLALTNDIVYGNGGSNVSFSSHGTVVSSCDIQGGYSGTTNINADPLFVNSPADLHLQSGSPCLGAGTASGAPATTIDGYTRPNPPSIGAYEAAPVSLPAAPTSLQAVVGNAQVMLSWTAPAGPVTSYTLYRGTSATSLTALKTGITATTFTNVSLKNGTTYYYAVAAVNSAGTGTKSSTASATPTGTSLPAAPTNLQALAGNAQVTLSWTAPAGTVTSYTLYRGTSAATLAVLKTGITATTFTNISLKNGTTYYYAVAAVNSVGTGAKSSTVSTTPLAPPAAPTNLQAVAGNQQVTLTWTAPAGTVTSYTLYRGTSATSLTALKTGITATTFTNVSLKHGTTYYYTVSAVNAGGTGPASNEASATP